MMGKFSSIRHDSYSFRRKLCLLAKPEWVRIKGGGGVMSIYVMIFQLCKRWILLLNMWHYVHDLLKMFLRIKRCIMDALMCFLVLLFYVQSMENLGYNIIHTEEVRSALMLLVCCTGFEYKQEIFVDLGIPGHLSIN